MRTKKEVVTGIVLCLGPIFPVIFFHCFMHVFQWFCLHWDMIVAENSFFFSLNICWMNIFLSVVVVSFTLYDIKDSMFGLFCVSLLWNEWHLMKLFKQFRHENTQTIQKDRKLMCHKLWYFHVLYICFFIFLLFGSLKNIIALLLSG